MAGNALYDLRQTVARTMGETITGTPDTNLAVGKFGCAALAHYSDDYFNDWRGGRFYKGPHKGTSFVVTNFEQANGVVFFDPHLATFVAPGDLFELYPDFTPEEITTAINMAIGQVEGEALQAKTDEGLVVRASTYEYPVPAGLSWIENIYEESSTSSQFSASGDSIDYLHWHILPGPTPKIWFDNEIVPTLTAGRRLRLVGQGAPAELVLDADVCHINKMYVVYQAKALLHQARIRGQGVDFEEHRVQMQMAQGLADRERQRLLVAGRGQKVVP